MKRKVPRFQLLTNCCIPYTDLIHKVELAIKSGVDCIQYRCRPGRECYTEAKTLAELCKQAKIRFVINDHVHMAYHLNQEGLQAGVWLGKQDMAIPVARSILGPETFIGLSVNAISELHRANHLPVDAVAANGVFACTSNPHAQVMGLAGLQEMVAFSEHPILAIGGITPSNVRDVFETDVDGIALSGAILRANDIENITKCLLELCNQYIDYP
ncbi:MAG: thiamine phosphate synthase [Rickettsiales bacterium]|nr:thiamine phosphate synthase [Rickettsiales bacterium]